MEFRTEFNSDNALDQTLCQAGFSAIFSDSVNPVPPACHKLHNLSANDQTIYFLPIRILTFKSPGKTLIIAAALDKQVKHCFYLKVL